MEPAQSIIKKLGGPAAVAEITGTAYTAPYRWQHPVARGGTGGLVPQRHIPKLLDHARRSGIALSADDFLPPPSRDLDDDCGCGGPERQDGCPRADCPRAKAEAAA